MENAKHSKPLRSCLRNSNLNHPKKKKYVHFSDIAELRIIYRNPPKDSNTAHASHKNNISKTVTPIHLADNANSQTIPNNRNKNLQLSNGSNTIEHPVTNGKAEIISTGKNPALNLKDITPKGLNELNACMSYITVRPRPSFDKKSHRRINLFPSVPHNPTSANIAGIKQSNLELESMKFSNNGIKCSGSQTRNVSNTSYNAPSHSLDNTMIAQSNLCNANMQPSLTDNLETQLSISIPPQLPVVPTYSKSEDVAFSSKPPAVQTHIKPETKLPDLNTVIPKTLEELEVHIARITCESKPCPEPQPQPTPNTQRNTVPNLGDLISFMTYITSPVGLPTNFASCNDSSPSENSILQSSNHSPVLLPPTMIPSIASYANSNQAQAMNSTIFNGQPIQPPVVPTQPLIPTSVKPSQPLIPTLPQMEHPSPILPVPNLAGLMSYMAFVANPAIIPNIGSSNGTMPSYSPPIMIPPPSFPIMRPDSLVSNGAAFSSELPMNQLPFHPPSPLVPFNPFPYLINPH